MIYQDTADMLAHQKPGSYVYGTNLKISADHGHVVLNHPPMFGMIAFAPSLRGKNRKFVPCKCRNPNWPEWTKAIDANQLRYATTYHEAVLLYDQLITKERLWHEHESEKLRPMYVDGYQIPHAITRPNETDLREDAKFKRHEQPLVNQYEWTAFVQEVKSGTITPENSVCRVCISNHDEIVNSEIDLTSFNIRIGYRIRTDIAWLKRITKADGPITILRWPRESEADTDA